MDGFQSIREKNESFLCFVCCLDVTAVFCMVFFEECGCFLWQVAPRVS